MTNGCKISNGKTNVSLTDIEGYQKMGVQTDPNMQRMLATELTDVTGQYTLEATNSEGKTAQTWMSLSASKGMGELDAKIECSDDGKITAYFKLAEGVDYYYIFLQKDSYDFTKYGLKYWSETDLKKITPETEEPYKDYYKLSLNVSDLLSSSAELAAGRYRVVAAAPLQVLTMATLLYYKKGITIPIQNSKIFFNNKAGRENFRLYY